MGLMAMLAMPAMAADAAADYKAKCQMCHAADGKGTPAMVKSMGVKDLTSADVQKMSDADLKAVIEKGKTTDKGKMKGFAGQVDSAALVAYIRGLKK